MAENYKVQFKISKVYNRLVKRALEGADSLMSFSDKENRKVKVSVVMKHNQERYIERLVAIGFSPEYANNEVFKMLYNGGAENPEKAKTVRYWNPNWSCREYCMNSISRSRVRGTINLNTEPIRKNTVYGRWLAMRKDFMDSKTCTEPTIEEKESIIYKMIDCFSEEFANDPKSLKQILNKAGITYAEIEKLLAERS